MAEKPRYATKDLPRTRDKSGKYIPGSSANYVKMEPFLEKEVFIRDGKFHSAKGCNVDKACCEQQVVEKHIIPKSSQEIEQRQRERKGKGYTPFKFLMSAPVNACCEICLPGDWNYRAIHVEDAFLQTNNLTFREALCCDDDRFCNDRPSLNEIWFTEGLIVECNEIKLTTGKCIIKSKTWTCIEDFQFLDPKSPNEFKCIELDVPCHKLSGHNITIFLLESCNFNPHEIQWWPFCIEEIVDSNTIIASPKRNGKAPLFIPDTFSPDIMLVLPPLGECQIAEFVVDGLPDMCVTWNGECQEYQVSQKSCSNRIHHVSKIIPKEADHILARVSPKRYVRASDLVPEIQRSMNPPLVLTSNQNITINGIIVSLDVREYTNAQDLALNLESKINVTLGWSGIFQEITVTYNDQTGRFVLNRIAPFTMEFGVNSLIDLLGFSDYVFVGNKEYISNFQIYYVSCIPSNRYLASYDCANDLISVRAVSKANYMSFFIPGYVPDEFYGFCPGNNFVIPFSFACGSPLTSYLQFQQKGCFLEWISTVGVSRLLGPPPILYMVIPELENDIVVSDCECLKSLFSAAMAILYLDGNGRTYKSKSVGCQNELTWKKNVSKDNLCKLTVRFYTECGIEYCLNSCQGVINLCLNV